MGGGGLGTISGMWGGFHCSKPPLHVLWILTCTLHSVYVCGSVHDFIVLGVSQALDEHPTALRGHAIGEMRLLPLLSMRPLVLLPPTAATAPKWGSCSQFLAVSVCVCGWVCGCVDVGVGGCGCVGGWVGVYGT